MRAKKEKELQIMGRRSQADDLLKQAMKQPGIQQLMAVYEDWKKVDNVAKPYREVMGVKRVISTSNTSGPINRRIG